MTPVNAPAAVPAMTDPLEGLPRNSMGWYGIPLAGETYFMPATIVAEIVHLRNQVAAQPYPVSDIEVELMTLRATLSERDAELARVRDEGFSDGLDAAAAYVERIGSYGSEGIASDIRALTPPPAPTEGGKL